MRNIERKRETKRERKIDRATPTHTDTEKRTERQRDILITEIGRILELSSRYRMAQIEREREIQKDTD